MSWDNCNATASPPIEAPPVMYLVQWTEDGEHWFGEHDEDGSPAMFWDEADAEAYVAAREAETTEDGEPTPYRYRIVEEWEEAG